MSFASVHHHASPHKVEAVGMTHTERLDLDPGGRVYAPGVGRNGLFIGELAASGGATRKAVRLYQTAGVLPPPPPPAARSPPDDAPGPRRPRFLRQPRPLRLPP